MLGVVGTLAMFLVAGGIYIHNWHALHEMLHFMPLLLGELFVGLVVGALALMVMKVIALVKQ